MSFITDLFEMIPFEDNEPEIIIVSSFVFAKLGKQIAAEMVGGVSYTSFQSETIPDKQEKHTIMYGGNTVVIIKRTNHMEDYFLLDTLKP